ncbi:MAG: amino acid adenylation domain-containing protein [Candidatus Aminicenantes bacterium]
MTKSDEPGKRTGLEIAVIGMAGRFPGAQNIEEFWSNLKNGVESIAFFSNKELEKAGIEHRMLENSNYVKARGILEGREYFDASFFGYSPREAEIMDPQLRIFHECVWTSLEDAGYNIESYQGSIGLYAGASSNLHWEGLSLLSGKSGEIGEFAAWQLRDKDFLSARTSFKLNLKGPSLTTYTACSTSLVTIHQASRALLSGECKMALAGGVCQVGVVKSGYLYQEGMVSSSDGHCRTFAAESDGTVSGSGVGIVVLKRLKEAEADRDNIYALIKGSSVNNDGFEKAGFTAPSVEGQAAVIKTALRIARVEPESISYIETHGTATSLGDPIEIEGLKTAFNTNKKEYCALGSVKTNIGHLDTAAGVAGFIKTVLSLKHRLIPPSLHFERSNPKIDFENSPFYVVNRLTEWKNNHYPLRAGVSSFGIGGTNAHVVLEEWPTAHSAGREDAVSQGRGEVSSPEKSREYHLILLSAKTPTALDKMTENLAEYFKKNLLNRGNHENPTNPGPTLADVAYTLQVGRKYFKHRKMMVCTTDVDEAVNNLSSNNSRKSLPVIPGDENRAVIFIFPGLGAQYVNMGLGIYQTEPVFRQEMDRCFEILKPLMGDDIKKILYPQHTPPFGHPSQEGNFKKQHATRNSQLATSSNKIDQIQIAQIMVFIFEYSLAKLLMKWGVKPEAMIGYSFGEYATACIAGVFSLEDALKLIVSRGKLIERVPAGSMLSVPLAVQELKPLLNGGLSIAIDNGQSCIVAGSTEAIAAFEKKMRAKKYLCMRLKSSRAIHSKMMEPILKDFKSIAAEITLNKPQIPYISNVTGDWLTPQEALNPGYWPRHLRETVRFNDGIKQLIKIENAVFIELGPGRDLSALMRRYVDINSNRKIVDTVRPKEKEISDVYFLLNKIGRLWLWGVIIDWNQFYTQEKRQRISLPTYSFDQHYFSIERYLYEKGRGPWSLRSLLGKPPKMANWYYVPTWKRSILSIDETTDELAQLRWLVFIDEEGLGSRVVEAIKPRVKDVITVQMGSRFSKLKDGEYTINTHEDHDYELLFNELSEMARYPDNILHLWGVFNDEHNPFEIRKIDKVRDLGYHSLINTAKAIGNRDFKVKIRFMVITNNMQEVLGKEQRYPEKAIILGPVKVIPKEYPNISCRSVDIMLSQSGDVEEGLLDKLLEEIAAKSIEPIVALRGNQRWVQAFESLPLEESEKKRSLLRPGCVYLITGGLGGIGLTLAQHLAQCVQAKLVLMGRSDFPARNQWDDWMNNHNENNAVSRKIQRLQSLEELGAKVLVLRADVSKQEQVQDAMKQVWEQFGQIDGVIHAAGLPDGKMIQRRTGEDCEDILAPKIKGTWILDRILKDVKLDFFILCSSTASIHGGIGQVAYCAANNFLDAFANYKHSIGGRFTVSINWGRWQNLGIATIAENLHKKLTGKDLTGGITSDEGIRSFSLILKDKLPQVIFTNRDLESLVQQSGSFKVPSSVEEFEETNIPETLYQRPELTNEYVAPRSEFEEQMANIWQNLFGFEQVGIRDDFFELGGDSLKVVIAISKIHKDMNVEIPVSEFFSSPTIEALSHYVLHAEESVYVPIEPVEEKEYYPLSSIQRRLYILMWIEPENTAYNEPKTVQLEGDLDRNKMEDAFKKLIRRHEIYRTSFHLVGGNPVQKVYPPQEIEFSLEYHETNGNVDNARELVESFVKPFDLSQAPLFRVRLIKISDRRHVLSVDIHHIVTDLPSDGLFVKEFLALYEGEELPTPRLQYRDYTEWQNSEAQQAVITGQEEFWLGVFAGEIPVLSLPTDYPRPETQRFEGDRDGFLLDKQQTGALMALARKEDVTLYMILLSLLNIFLSKLSGQEDIIIGTPVAGRRHADLLDIPGAFINTIAFRNYPAGEKIYHEFLQEIRETTIKSFDNQDYPFEDLIDQVKVNRDISRNPMFDVQFLMQNTDEPPEKALEVVTSTFKLMPFSHSLLLTKSDLGMVVAEARDNLLFSFQYCTKLFRKETIGERFIPYFKNIVSSILEDRDQQLSDIEIITEKEKNQLLFDFNNTRREYPREKTIHELFADQVEQRPDHTALIGQIPNSKSQIPNQVSITYKELNKRSNQLAHLLKEKGVKPDTIVGIMVERSFEMFIGLLGILKAGGAFLPIDPGPNFPWERTDFMLADSGARILLASPETRVKVKAEVEERFIEVIDISNLLSFSPSTSTCRVSSANLAYVIYTSGSTGKPKGVMIHHQPVHNFIRGITQRIDFTPGKTILALTTISFDIFVLETLLPLSQGLRIVIANEHQQLEINILEELIVKSCVDMLQATPTRMRIFTGSGRPVSCLKELKEIMIGGEPFPGRLLGRVRKLTPARIYNMYGPTETTVWSTMKDLTPITSEKINIGKPILNTHVYILNKNYIIQPVGVIGHLCIGGDGLARGYLNLPELTTEKFTSAINDRLYMTGDLARWLPDGNIEFLGRIDHQVKIRGFRIELEEIETHLQTYDKIKEAVVLVKEKDGDKYLYAYIVPGKESPPNVSELRQYLSGKLPDYMIPSHFVVLEKIPLTPNGKVSRKILYALDTKLNIASEYVPPKSELEKTIASVWQEVLKLDKVSINHNFFDLGGNSMSLIQVNNRLREVLGIDIRIVILFRYTMIRTLARYLSNTERVNHLFQEEKLDALDRGKNKLRHLKRRMGNVMN